MVLHVWQQRHQHKQDSFSTRHSITTIQVPADQLHWERKEKELLIDGKHFDVFACKIENGIAQLTGHFDEKEGFFAKALNLLQDKKTTQGENPFAIQQLQWCSFFISLPPASPIQLEFLPYISTVQQFYLTQVYIQPVYDVPGIPPWC